MPHTPTHAHTHTCTYKNIAMSTLLELETWLSWISPCSPFLFSICLSVGEPVWGKMMPTVQMPCLTFFSLTLGLRCSFTPLFVVLFCFAITVFFPRSLLVHLFPSALSLFATVYPPPTLPPSLCRFCGSAPLTKSQRETSAGVPAKFLCLSAQITWDSPNYHVANQSISWVSTGDACPPLLWL